MTTFASSFEVAGVTYVLYYNDLSGTSYGKNVLITTLADPSDPSAGFLEVCSEQWPSKNAPNPIGYNFAEMFIIGGQPYFLCYQWGTGSAGWPGSLSIRALVDPQDPTKGTNAIWTASITDWYNRITVAASFKPEPDRLFFLLHMGTMSTSGLSTFVTKLVDDKDPSKGVLSQSEAIWSAAWSSSYVFITTFYSFPPNAPPTPHFIAHNPVITSPNLDNLFLMTPVDCADLSAGLKTDFSQFIEGGPYAWKFATPFYVGEDTLTPYFLLSQYSGPSSHPPANYRFNTAILGFGLDQQGLRLEPLYTTTWNPGYQFAVQLAIDGVPFFVTYNPNNPTNQTTQVATLASATTVMNGLTWIYQSSAFFQMGDIEFVVAFGNDPQFIAQPGDQDFLDCARAVVGAISKLPNILWPATLSTIGDKPIGRAAAFLVQGDLTDFGGGVPAIGQVWGPKLGQFRHFFEPGASNEATQVPVLCGLGNHDLDAQEWYIFDDFFRNQMWAYIRDRYAPFYPPLADAPMPQPVQNIDARPMASYGETINQDDTWRQQSHNYSFQIAGIRFIQLHRFGGDTRYDRAGGLNWLKSELRLAEDDASCVAVVLLQHFGFYEDIGPDHDTQWTSDEQYSLFRVLAESKTIALFHGHDHTVVPRKIVQNPSDGHLYEDLDPGSIKPDKDNNPPGRSIGVARFAINWERTQLVMDIAMGRATADGSTIEFGAPDQYVYSNSWDISSRKWLSPNPRFLHVPPAGLADPDKREHTKTGGV
ncbi:metallophosphoesterase family protein [Bradyrhizobium sp.]|uniref:metallophosphoesterase family protein n=1 Tax=Bradyrhizobium sp. TaxID=376 RepID=UPI003C69A8D6